jgi:hypothetical protein
LAAIIGIILRGTHLQCQTKKRHVAKDGILPRLTRHQTAASVPPKRQSFFVQTTFNDSTVNQHNQVL